LGQILWPDLASSTAFSHKARQLRIFRRTSLQEAINEFSAKGRLHI
jgi:hypothetical protein